MEQDQVNGETRTDQSYIQAIPDETGPFVAIAPGDKDWKNTEVESEILLVIIARIIADCVKALSPSLR